MKPNQISNTAAFIGVKFYGLTRDQHFQALFDDEVITYYDRLVGHLPAPLRYYHTGLRSKLLRKFFVFWEELLLPGDLMHIILRKYYLSGWVNRLKQSGYEQMLVLGAGFDHLGVLNVSAEFRCLELDTRKMMRTKQDFLNSHRYDHSNLRLKGAFFTRDDLYDLLKEQSLLAAEEKTIIIAEGFFDYFRQSAGAQILGDVDRYFENDITLLSTIFSLQELSGFRSQVYKKSIKLAGEKLKLHMDSAAYQYFLKGQGYAIKKCYSPDKMYQEILEPSQINLPVLPGFYLLEAFRNRKKP